MSIDRRPAAGASVDVRQKPMAARNLQTGLEAGIDVSFVLRWAA
jgi:hypothetical protein